MDINNIMALWKEFNPDANKSIQEDFMDKPYPFITKIITYLNNGKTKLTATSYSTDVITGEPIHQTRSILTDGTFTWSNTLAYYVEKYNLQLPDDFVQHILNAME